MTMSRYSAFASIAICIITLGYSLVAFTQEKAPPPEVKMPIKEGLQKKHVGPGGAPVDEGLKRYMDVIVERNLFLPLGSGRREETPTFALTAVISNTSSGSSSKAIIEEIDGEETYYVSEGDTFARGIKVVDIDEQLVKLDRSGEEMELRLGEGTEGSRRRGKDVIGGEEQRSGKDRRPEGDSHPGGTSDFGPGQFPSLIREAQGERGISIQELLESSQLEFRSIGGSGPGQNIKFYIDSVDGDRRGEIRIMEVPSEVKGDDVIIIEE